MSLKLIIYISNIIMKELLVLYMLYGITYMYQKYSLLALFIMLRLTL